MFLTSVAFSKTSRLTNRFMIMNVRFVKSAYKNGAIGLSAGNALRTGCGSKAKVCKKASLAHINGSSRAATLI